MLFDILFQTMKGPAGGSAPTRPQKTKKSKTGRKPVGNAGTRVIINLVITLAVGAIYFYFALPVLNPQDESFYGFILMMCLVYIVSAMVTSGFQSDGVKSYVGFVKKQCRIPLIVVAALAAAFVVGGLISATIFRAGAYSKLLPIETGDFTSEVTEISYDQIPMLDRQSAERLGDRKLGELSDMVSQFEVMDDYTQINYQGRPVRIATLTYADLIKWFTNRGTGLPAYLIIDMVTQNVELVRLQEGIKYTTVEHFGRNLYRHLRFSYPTFMFDDPVMEINEEGVPYWICPRLVKTIGLFGGVDVRGAVLVNAVTGESQYYEEVPSWVDNLYSADLIIQQYDFYGKFRHGFFNSIFGQKDVTVTTEGYNYIAINDDVFVYTGVTSTGGDQSNIGFILTNQRTKETKFYSCAGATEYSAMDSAAGELQNLRYTATFPLLLNVGGQPTYFMAMKDAAQLVKMYAMVNVQQYQIVATGNTVAECEANYLSMMRQSGIGEDGLLHGEETVTGIIAEIRSAVMDGNTVFYLRLEGGQTYYTISAADSPTVVILNLGDRVSITYTKGETEILSAHSVTRK